MTALALGTGFPARAAAPAETRCAHCGQDAGGGRFCCAGCEAAFEMIQGLGLGRYYQQRLLDPALRAPRPETAGRWDLVRYVRTDARGVSELTLAVGGLQCGACVWLIESVLAREPDILAGRVNMTTRRLRLAWRGAAAEAARLVGRVEALGYRLVPFDPACLAAAQDRSGRALLRALAVAGFAAGNVMFISIGTWAGLTEGMGPATRALMHWVSALIAMPAIAYAGMPFFRSAFAALRAGRTNMDVPVSIGVVLVTAMSLAETMRGGAHTYFDSAVTLLFFLLIGRVLDHRARGQARATAEQLLTLRASDVAVLQPDGTVLRRPQETVEPGERVLAGMGERIGVDGVLERGRATLDASLVTGEGLPVTAGPGAAVFAGTLNLGEPVVVRATATGEATLLAECVRLIEAAEARRGRFVVLADRVARRYAPAVHACAALTFLLWWGVLGAPVADSLLTAAAVLIITCPCALALAVPAVQVIATSRLFRAGILLKSPTALERLAEIDTVVFDKTGTLTEPMLGLADSEAADPEALRCAAGLAAASRHPLARSLAAAAGAVAAAPGVTEHPGQGLSRATPEGEIRLGSRAFCGISDAEGPSDMGIKSPLPLRAGQSHLMDWAPPPLAGLGREADQGRGRGGHRANCRQPRAAVNSPSTVEQLHRTHPLPLPPPARGGGDQFSDAAAERPELWLTRPGLPPVRFVFDEVLRGDARETVARLGALGLRLIIASGDRPAPVARIAGALGIAEQHAGTTPAGKTALLETLRAEGRRVLMVGDGLNDGPSLAAAHVSASPATGADVSQNVADVVFQGRHLQPLLEIIFTARRARRVMRQNLGLSIGYNLVMLPLAVAGFVTPWLAAAAMSSSSLAVMASSFRMNRKGAA